MTSSTIIAQPRPDIDPDRAGLMLIAVHEAAHAVVAHALGFRLRWVSARKEGGTSLTVWDDKDDDSRQAAIERIAVFVAGIEVNSRMMERGDLLHAYKLDVGKIDVGRGVLSANEDIDGASSTAFHWIKDNHPDLSNDECEPLAKTLFYDGVHLAQKTISERVVAIHALTESLMERGKIGGHEATRIIKDAMEASK